MCKQNAGGGKLANCYTLIMIKGYRTCSALTEHSQSTDPPRSFVYVYQIGRAPETNPDTRPPYPYFCVLQSSLESDFDCILFSPQITRAGSPAVRIQSSGRVQGLSSEPILTGFSERKLLPVQQCSRSQTLAASHRALHSTPELLRISTRQM